MMARRSTAAGALCGAVLVVLYLAPLLWLVMTSFKTRSQALAVPPEIWFAPTLENYRTAVSERGLQATLRNSLVLAGASAVLSTVLALPVAFAISRGHVRNGAAILFAFLSAKMVPAMAVAIPMYWIFGQVGMLDSMGALIMANVATNLVVSLWLLRVVLDSIPRSVEEAGVMDGMSMGNAVVWLVCPAAAVGVAASSMVIFAMTWGEMALASVLAGFVRRPLTVAMFGLITPHGTFWGDISALATLSVIPAAALAGVFVWWWRH